MLRFDPVLALIENTLKHPANVATQTLSATGTCPTVARSFLNKASCVLRPAGICSPPAFKEGVRITFESAVLRMWYIHSKRHLHLVKGLRLEDPYDVSPCKYNYRSRWLRKVGWCKSTKLDKDTLATMISALKQAGTVDKNPYMRDLVLSDYGGVCSTARITVGAKIQVDGDCFENVHPDLLSVFDMSYWVLRHPGNVQAAKANRPNPISAVAERGETEFLFPSHHPMQRWAESRRWVAGKRLIFEVARMGDTPDFASLDTELQTEEIAVALGAKLDTANGGVEACGSPGEVANIPSNGHHFYFLTDHAFDIRSTMEGDINSPYTLTMGKSSVWYNVVLNAPDQLRHRMAWALSQIIVVAEGGVSHSATLYEPWLGYFDILVRNAFGNYRNILKEVVFNPLMGVYLTYRGNKAYAYDKLYPDENFSREIMQLFTIGLWKLNPDGTQVLDNKGEPVPTYSNDEIVAFAKVGTLLYRGGYLDGVGNREALYL